LFRQAQLARLRSGNYHSEFAVAAKRQAHRRILEATNLSKRTGAIAGRAISLMRARTTPMMLKRRARVICAIMGTIMAASTTGARAQCDDRYPMSCRCSAPHRRKLRRSGRRLFRRSACLSPSRLRLPSQSGRCCCAADRSGGLKPYDAGVYAGISGDPFRFRRWTLARSIRSSCVAPSSIRPASRLGRS